MKLRVVAAAGLAAVLLAACGEPPDENADDGTTGGGTRTDFRACMVTDQGGIDDRSFNASAWAGLQAAGDAGNFPVKYITSKTEADYTPNVASLVREDCGLIVTVGYALGDATRSAALANPDERFTIVDEDPDGDPSTDVHDAIPNVQPLMFNTAEAAFLAGYLAGGMTKTGTVGAFGGTNVPAVAVFLDGFSDGIAKYNADTGRSVRLLGWNKATQNGTFAGKFDAPTDGKRITTNLVQQGADIVLPVAGQTGLGATSYATENPGHLAIIWVDQDGYYSVPQAKDVMLTTIEKNVSDAVERSATATAAGAFSNAPYIGTLADDGVGLAPFHSFEAKVPVQLAARIDELRAQIIDGTITVESQSSPVPR